MKFWSNTSFKNMTIVVIICFFPSLVVAQPLDSMQSSGLFIASEDQQYSANSEDKIRQYLAAKGHLYGRMVPDRDLVLSNIKTSLTAKHYHFQQHHNHVPVDRSEIIVSVGLNDHKIQKIYNSLAHVSGTQMPQLAAVSKPVLKKDEALQLVWISKPLHSRLIAKPTERLVYANYQGSYRLVYRISMPVDKEEGDWEYTLDALTGQILVVERLDIPAKPSADFQRYKLPASLDNTNTKTPLAAELQRFDHNKSLKMSRTQKMMRTNGSGYVFDPDPRTALNNVDLQHDSPVEAFENAYVQKTLLDIKQDGDNYFLDGPWVSIQELDAPEDAPSSTIDGNWVAKRTDDGFLDVMAYFHLDQSQRYMRSLGFVGEKAIQDGPIAVDTNGFSGQHNAYYMSVSNQIVFGKADGCPPMAEDADVIMHEYGHAIQHDINPNWYGGDTGAIGEGFSDYWAASYSVSTVQGASFYPERASNWAGFNDCWEGRFLNRTDIRYNPSRFYEAHEFIDDYWSDELWSTPLFQSLLTLMEMGIPREQVDTIILEAHFGLGTDISMRDMAMATVIAANTLYPEGPHARVFREKFEQMNILSAPLIIDSVKIIGGGTQQLLLPGGQLGLYPDIRSFSWKNPLLANLEITDISGNLETISEPVKSISVNAGSTQSTEFNIQVKNDAECGALVDMQYELSYQDPDGEQPISSIKNITSIIGAPVTQEFKSVPGVNRVPYDEILELELEVDGVPIVPQYFQVYLDIRDDIFTDPKVVLRSPDGTRVQLPIFSDWSDRIQRYFPDSMGNSTLFEALKGKNAAGTWVLEVSNGSIFRRSIVKQWGIKTLVSADCSPSPNQGDFTIASIEAATSFNEQSRQLDIDPGDTVDLSVRITNESLDEISHVNMNIVTNENFPLEVSTYSQETLGALKDLEANFKFNLPYTYECEKPLLVNLVSSYSVNGEENQIVTPIEFNVGSPVDHKLTSFFSGTIPDNDMTGIVSELYVNDMLPIDLDKFSVFLNLEHASTDELRVTLRSPEGMEVVLMDNDRDGSFIYGDFPGDYTASGDMSVLKGINPNGLWTLTVQDDQPDNTGSLILWGINGSAGVSCNSSFFNEYPEARLANDDFLVDEGALITLDASASTDDDMDSLKFMWRQLEGPYVELSSVTDARVQFTAPQVLELTSFVYEVEVTDYFGNTDSIEVTISVRNKVVVPNPSSGRSSSKSGGGGISLGLLVGLLLLMIRYGFCRLASKNN